MNTPELNLALSFAQAIRAEQALMSINGEPGDTLEASRRARARIEQAKSEREIAEALQRVAAAKLNRTAPAPSSASARFAPAVSVGAQQGRSSSHRSSELSSVPIASYGFSIGLSRLSERSRVIAERFITENFSRKVVR